MLSLRALKTIKRTFQNIYYTQNVRHFLSPAYQCQETWNLREKDPHIMDIKPLDFYYELLRKYKREGKLSAIDTDLFIHSIQPKNIEKLAQEIEEALHILRNTPETINTLPSTIHAAIRILFEAGKYENLLKIISNPPKYGVFLDYYLSNSLMDTFLKQQNYTGAARIASHLMLQEEFGSSLANALSFLSCIKFSINGEGDNPWIDYHPFIEPEEEVKILVAYVRNPYFDEHFDLKNPNHIVGKTLALLSMHLEEPFKSNAAVVGWCLFEKWDTLNDFLKSSLQKNIILDATLFEIVEAHVDKCEDEEVKSRLRDSITALKNSNIVQNLDIEIKASQEIEKLVQESEGNLIKDQEALYATWITKREQALKAQLAQYEKTQLLEEIKEKKKYLNEKEELLYFFENKEKIEMRMPKKTAKDVQLDKDSLMEAEEYIVPEV